MLPSSVRIVVCTQPQDLRRSFDGLALATREVLGEDPRSGIVVVFTNRRMNRLKLLWWDRNGFCVLYKRLHGARVAFPGADPDRAGVAIDARSLGTLLLGVTREKPARRGRKAA